MLKSLSSNWARVIVSIVVNFFLTPFLTRKLGVDLFGSWAVITAYTGWLGLMQIGIPMASVRLFAQSIAKGDCSGLNRAVSTALRISLMIGVLAALGGCLLFMVYNFVNLPKVASTHLGDARLAFIIAVVQLIVGFACQVPYGIMAAHQDFPVSNLVQISAIVGRFAALWTLLSFFPGSLMLVAGVNLGISLLEGSFGVLTVRRRYPGIHPQGGLDRALAKGLLGFSAYVLILNLGNQLSFATDSIVISGLIGDHAVASFETGKMFVIYLTEFLIGLAAVVMPMTVKLEALGQQQEVRSLLRKWLKVAFSLALLPGLYLIVFGEPFIARWIDTPGFDAHAAGTVLQVLMIGHLVFLPARGVALPVLMGLGRPVAVTVAFGVSSFANLALSLILVKPLGLFGVALGTALPEVLFALYAILASCRESGAHFGELLRHCAARTLPAALLLVALLHVVSALFAPASWVALIGIGVIYTLLFAALWCLFVYRGDPEFEPYLRWRNLSWKRSPG